MHVITRSVSSRVLITTRSHCVKCLCLCVSLCTVRLTIHSKRGRIAIPLTLVGVAGAALTRIVRAAARVVVHPAQHRIRASLHALTRRAHWISVHVQRTSYAQSLSLQCTHIVVCMRTCVCDVDATFRFVCVCSQCSGCTMRRSTYGRTSHPSSPSYSPSSSTHRSSLPHHHHPSHSHLHRHQMRACSSCSIAACVHVCCCRRAITRSPHTANAHTSNYITLI